MNFQTHKISKEIHLEGVIFSLPSLTLLNGMPTLPQIFNTPLLRSQELDPSQVTSFLANSNLVPSEIPNCLFNPQESHSLSCHSLFELPKLLNCVQYQFSDGQVINAQEIFYHHYSKIIRPEFLATLRNIRADVLKSTWLKLLPGLDLPLWGHLRQTELALISVLLNASLFKISERPGAPRHLWLTHSQDRTSQRLAATLEAIHINPQSLSGWSLVPWDSKGTPATHENGIAVLEFTEKTIHKDGIIFEQFEISKNKQILHFHSYQRQMNLTLHSVHIHNRNEPDSGTLIETPSKPNSFQIRLFGNSTIASIADNLDKKLEAHGFPPLTRYPSQTITVPELKFQIWIENQGVIKFCRFFKTEQGFIKVWNLPQDACSIIKGLQGGLGAVIHKKSKLLLGERKGARRDRDMKILRHAGFFACMLLETLNYINNIKELNQINSQFPQFFQTLLNRLGNLAYEIEKKSGLSAFSTALPLDRICSPTLIDLMKKYILTLLELNQSGTEKIYGNFGEIRIERGFHAALCLFRVLLSSAANKSNGLCFLKPRLSHFNSFFDKISQKSLPTESDLEEKQNQESQMDDLLVQYSQELHYNGTAQDYNVTQGWISMGKILHGLYSLENLGFSLFYEQLPIHQMDPLDFKPEFILTEPDESKTHPETAIDWFELHPKLFFQGKEIHPNVLGKLSKEGILEFQGKIFLIHNKNLPTVKKLEEFWSKIHGGRFNTDPKKKTTEKILRLPRNQTLEILALRASGISVKGGARWQKICAFYDSLDQKRAPIILPKSIKAHLKPYQAMGVQWLLDLYSLGLGGILADDMGLGKTVQTLSFLEILRSQEEMNHTLIIVPTSLTFNWQSESAKFTPDLPIQIFQSKSKDQTIHFLNKNNQAALICTYGLFTEHIDFFTKTNWNILIFDEAQNLKNLTAKRTAASRHVSAKFKICLTGTPMENHLGEFYSLLDLAVPGSLGDLTTFRSKFISPDSLNPEDIKHLKLKVKPLVLRRTKSEILTELPPKLETTVKLPFEKKQEKIYRDIALSWNDKVKNSILNHGEAKSQLLMLTALLRLRQTCSDPGSIPHVKYLEEPPKITVLMEALQEITESGESALVFTQFLHTFTRIKKQLISSHIQSFSLHGGTSRTERERTLQAFQQEPKGSVLLMTLKTGGVGLNLVKASYVFHIEPWWNPAVENQASDRAHRIGQVKPVQVYRYLMKESVEEKIEILKNRKSSKFNSLFSSSESPLELSTEDNFLSRSDFEYLIF